MTYEQKLKEMVLKDDQYVVMTAENRAPVRSLPSVLGDRFIDTGITEQTMVGAAAGLALRGRKPIAHALATFLTMRAFEFIRTDVGIPSLPVTLVGFVPGFLSDGNGPTHQAIEDIALMRMIPKMQIFCPADEQDLVIGMEKVIASDSPAYIRYNTRPALVDHDKDFDLGKAEVFGEGKDVTLLTYGMLFSECWQAKQKLEAQGFDVTLVNLRTLSPLDEKTVLRVARESRLLVTVEDHFLVGGLFSILSELLTRNALRVPVLPLGLDGCWFKPAVLKDVISFEGFSGEQIAQKVSRQLESQTGGTC